MNKADGESKKKGKRSLREQDPHRDREVSSYGEPLPSREFILRILAEQGVPVSAAKLAKIFAIESVEMEAFNRRLGAMERAGQIIRNRKDAICIVDKLDLITGTVQGHPDGFGFLLPDDGSPDLFLGPKEMKEILHGDRVMVREVGLDRRGRREAKIVEVLERVNKTLVGRVYVEHGFFIVVAENKRISQDILVPREEAGGAKAGQVVMIEI